MASGAYNEVAMLGFTYAEDAAKMSVDVVSKPDVENIMEPRQSIFNPQDSCWCIREDFIIFAEFSEVQGPLPLLTIPTHIQEDEDLDMNGFILKIMSVDYQANHSGHFSLVEDAQVLLTSVVQNTHAYVHYFTLHDLHARGFVRPMCLAYVSRDKEKLQSQFSSLREKFLNVTYLLKYNNRQGFLEELSHNLQHLKSSQEQYFEWQRQQEEGIALSSSDSKAMLSTQIGQLVQQYTEYKHLQHIVEPALCDDKTSQLFKLWEEVFFASDLREVRHFVKKLSHHVPPSGIHTPTRGETIRPVLAISAWGSAVGLHHLLRMRDTIGMCSLEVQYNVFSTSFTPSHPKIDEGTSHGPEDALLSKEYLKLLHNLTYPKEWNGDESYAMNATVTNNEVDFLETNYFASGNEGSSSYHSAPSSMGERTTRKLRNSSPVMAPSFHSAESSCSSESFQELCCPEEGESWSGGSSGDDEEIMATPWSGCLWGETPSHHKTGRHILRFFIDFPDAAQHVLYSILIGRTVVLAGAKKIQRKIRRITNALYPLLPGTKPAQVLCWHQGILVQAHIDKYKIIGVCVPERISVHDMISPRDKNCVTILDVGSKQLCGPAYSGQLLKQLEPSCVCLIPCDQTLLLLLQSVFADLDSKVFLCQTAGLNSLKELDYRGCDMTIIKHLSSFSRIF